MNKLDLFKKQQALRAGMTGKPLLHAAADPAAVALLLEAEAQPEQRQALDYFSAFALDAHSDPQEARLLVQQLEQAFDGERLDSAMKKAQDDVIAAIAGPFGLGKVLAAYDKVGGNVTTVHNANAGHYARKEDEYNRDHYTKTANSQGKQFEGKGDKSVGSVFTRDQMGSDKHVNDAYTGERILASKTSPDHIVSNSAFHKDGGFMLSKTARADFGTDTDNLVSTRRDINQSMSDADKQEWAARNSNGRKISNEEHFGIDKDLLKATVARGEAAAQKHAPSLTEKGAYYAENAARTGVNEGMKMGAQQAFGVLMVELFSAAFGEIKSLYAHGRSSDSLLEELRTRLTRVGEQVSSKWHNLIDGFSGGFISGFISNAVTMMINMFITTGKRAVRMIREGVFSLLKALKMLIIRPQDLTFEQAAHEAMKLLAVGGVVVGGVLLEEAVEKLIVSVPLFAPFAATMTAVFVGSVTALSMTLVCYLIDKLDLLGVIKASRDKAVLAELDTKVEQQLQNSMRLIDEIDAHLLPA